MIPNCIETLSTTIDMNAKSLFVSLLALLCMASSAFSQIQAGRAIQITVSGVPAEEKGRFDPVYPVSESGMINMPFIGPVRAAGMSSDGLQSMLESRYKAAGIYRNPTFQVIDNDAKRIVEQMVHVGGFVRGPGPKPYNRNLTLWQAIQAAGGANEFGSMKRVKLTRRGSMKQYDCTKAQFQQIPLEPDDTIEVPQKNWIGD
jgi:protein involved in polysaccharide export with SLBB domain